jgi:hypothetical protein
MRFVEQITQMLALVGRIPPTNHGTNTGDNSIAGIDMSVLSRLITIANVGILDTANAANIQLYYRASATSNMASPTNVASSIPITANTNNRIETLEVRADQLPSGTRYVQPVLIVNGATANISIDCWATADYSPGNQFNVANLADQQVVT